MATKIKDQATAERAAQRLQQGVEVGEKPGEPPAPKEKTTAEKLFPEFTTDDGGIVNRPIRPYQDSSKPLPASATPVIPPQGQTPAVQPPTAPVYVGEADLKGKMVRLKVDGVEQDVPAETLIKTNQLERHLNAQLMTLAQERKQLEDERRRLQTTPTPSVELPKKPESPVKKSAEVEALESRLAQMEASMAQERALLMPQIQEAGIKRVEQMAKERLGTDDFRTYFDKIRASALEEVAKPENAGNPQARAYFDSDAFYFQKYQEMKLRDLISKPSAPTPAENPSAPVLQTQQGAPVVLNNQGQPVSIPNFEGSGGVPSKASPDANWQSTYNALFTRAQASGSQDDWMALYRHKIKARE